MISPSTAQWQQEREQANEPTAYYAIDTGSGRIGFTTDPNESNRILWTNGAGRLEVSSTLTLTPAATMALVGERILFPSIP